MRVLARRVLWRNPYAIEKVPAIGRLHQAAYAPMGRMRYELAQLPLRKLFAAAYRLGLGGKGRLQLRSGAAGPRSLEFDGRNLQFASLYMPGPDEGYEPELTVLLDQLVADDSVFLDVGSNWGYFALMVAAREGFRGRVHAFEPSPSSFADLAALTAAAGLEGKLLAHNTGLSDRAGSARLAVPDAMHSGTAKVSATGGAEIRLERLDDLDTGSPGFIKLDVEEHEAEALTGARRTLAASKPHLFFESWLKPGRAAEAWRPLEILDELGYALFHPAWAEPGEGDALRAVTAAPLRDGAQATLVLVPFELQQRGLLKTHLNVFACHRDRLPELQRVFEPR